MNGFFWASKYIFKHKRRTLLTALGIALAIALVCGTGILFDSFRTLLINVQILSDGNWHYDVSGELSREQAETLAANYSFDAGAVYSDDTYAQFDAQYTDRRGDTNNVIYEPRYLCVLEADSNYLDMSQIMNNISAGRLPENQNEIAMSLSAREAFANLPSLGDKLTLPIGSLSINGDADDETYTFSQTGTREFTVVGFYKSIYTDHQKTYHAFSVPDGGEHAWSVRARLKGSTDYNARMLEAIAQAGLNQNALSVTENSSLLRYYAQGIAEGAQMALLSTCGLLIAIILAMMILVVRNTFAISIDEKMQQFGILRCLGASRKRIYSIVTSEALLMWLIAAPVGTAGAVLAMNVLFMIIHSLDSELLKYLEIHWTLWPFALALGVSLICVVLAAMSPARKCARVSPIGAVRGEGSLRSSVKKARGGKLLKHALGFSGLMSARNMRRNPRKYRATLLSVACSIALFLVMNGFASGYRASIHMYSGMDGMDVRIQGNVGDNIEEVDAELKKLDSVGKLSAFYQSTGAINVPSDKIASEYQDLLREYGESALSNEQRLSIRYIDRAEFEDLNFEGNAPSYEEFAKPGNAVIFQKAILASSSTGINVMPIATYSTGESINFAYESTNPDNTFPANANICGSVKSLPWYCSFDGSIAAFIAEDNMPDLSRDSNYCFAMLAKSGQQSELSTAVNELSYTNTLLGWSVSDMYNRTRENKSVMQVMDIFLYGFTAVIVLICSMNLLNTVKTNLHSRRREMAMLRAIGMSRQQMIKMLALECIWYAVIGTVLGAIIGLPLEYLLFKAAAGMLTIDFASAAMLLLLPICLVVTCAISLLAGMGPIREILRQPATEGIRAIE